MKEITSKDNKIIKKFKGLQQKKIRDKNNEFLIEGMNLILEVIKNEIILSEIIISKGFYNLEREIIDKIKSENIYIVSDDLFSIVSDTSTPQGVIAIVEKPSFNSLEIIETDSTNVLVLDRIQDPGNMGAILRTADASGIDCVLILKGSVDIYSSKVVRSTTGSIFRVPVLFIDDDKQAVELLNTNSKKIIVTSLQAKDNYFNKELKENIAIVIGNEAAGASDYFHENADDRVIIPMLRETESLNAGVAASILMYEIVRQKLK